MDGGAAGHEVVELGELACGGGQTDPQALGFAEPAFPIGLGDEGDQVVANLFQASSLFWSRP
ncbi:hypothetical protein ITP53_47135 [Nonomuraea sp. K274]|uniref:Uncharacterized protein n=1 Tax=Nonomuraea cypriaca TaxID=1187855 RepID=A0A931AHL1_9ACTN|nr:hypothetical protein [Nonomuraea cypriaca]MBF8193122.1 hypothetical protein [Nonomuraea cypriaca]